MLTNSEIKLLSSLKNKKFRNLENKFIVEGKRLLSEAFNSTYFCELILLTENFINNQSSFIKELSAKKIRTEKISEQNFNKISDTRTPQGILGVFRQKNILNLKNNQQLIIGLENISDPGNMGAIVRTCNWFGIENIILSSDCADIYNPKVVRSSMGALFHLNILKSENFFKDLKEMQERNREIICADMEGENIFDIKQLNNSILIISNEANGPSDTLLEMADRRITIPKYGKVESLNAASAAAVIIANLIGRKI